MSQGAASPRDGGSSAASKPTPVAAMRRESFLYRSDSDFDMSPKSLSRASSLNANDTSVCLLVTGRIDCPHAAISFTELSKNGALAPPR